MNARLVGFIVALWATAALLIAAAAHGSGGDACAPRCSVDGRSCPAPLHLVWWKGVPLCVCARGEGVARR